MARVKTVFYNYYNLIRFHQYAKNLFIFLPLFFAAKITNANLLAKSAAAFIGFSLVASSVYIFNDLSDIKYDRQHPVKKNRPLASRAISARRAVALLVIFLILGMSICYILNIYVFYLVLFYVIMSAFYTFRLKQIPIVDVIVVAIGFVTRILIGGVVTKVELSHWIIIVTFLLAIFLALAKRRDDCLIFIRSGEKIRKNIELYNIEFINISMAMMASVVIVSYIMYTVSPEVILKTHTDKLYLTSFFVLLGILRYLQITFVENKSGSPTEILLRDRFTQITIIGWLVLCGGLDCKFHLNTSLTYCA